MPRGAEKSRQRLTLVATFFRHAVKTFHVRLVVDEVGEGDHAPRPSFWISFVKGIRVKRSTWESVLET